MLHKNIQLFVIYYITCLLNHVSPHLMRLSAPKVNILTPSDHTPCDSPIIKVDPSQLNWRYKGIAPWFAQPSTMIYNSTSVTDAIHILRSAFVPGINTTFYQTFTIFQDVNCSLYIGGGAVRDYLLGISPTNIDIEYSCDPQVMKSACIHAYGNDSCHFIHSPYFDMGQEDTLSAYEVLEGVNWNSTIFGPSFTKEYTTNAVSYDLQNDVILDIIGSGVNDTCSKLIRIPVNESFWSDWMTESYYLYMNGIRKLPLFWKLRADPKSYEPADNNTILFIESNVKKLWKNNTFNVEDSFRRFYCKMVDGNLSVNGAGCCVLSALNKDAKHELDAYNDAIEKDLGTKWYQQNIVKDNVNTILVQSNGEKSNVNILHIIEGISIAIVVVFVVLLVMFCIVRKRKADELNQLNALMESYDDRYEL